eukprot:7916910-Heterocapsa_arctica.AAC.1
MGDFSAPYGGVDASLICAVMFYAQIGNHAPGSCTDTGFMKAPGESAFSLSDRRCAITVFVTSMVTNPDDMMRDNS